MDKEQRIKLLKKLAASNEGEALRDHCNELATKMRDGRTYEWNSFETSGKTSLKAADILEKIARDLNALKEPEKKIGKNQYR